MNSEDFYSFEPYSIGIVNYFRNCQKRISEEEEQSLLDNNTREYSNTFRPPPGLNPNEYSALFTEHYSKSRMKSREIIENSGITQEKVELTIQVGNSECLEEILSISRSPNFIKWENPGFMEYFIAVSKNLSGLC